VTTAGFSIVNQATANGYTAACTIENVPAGTVNTLQIYGASVIMQLQRQYGPGDKRWGGERFMGPVVGSLGASEVTGIRFKSAAAGIPARVSVTIE
jgi:hypothetical protein